MTLIDTLPSSIERWPMFVSRLNQLQEQDETLYRDCLRYLARTSTYFLLRYLMGRRDLEREWIHERCVEVNRNPYGYIDLWGRYHYKSTIITLGDNIRRILASHGDDPTEPGECSICIFSHTRPIAKKFLSAIKQELEINADLKLLFPDILYENPQTESPKWGEDSGLVVRRKVARKEATVEAWGLVDAQPTGLHFTDLTYDDVVTISSVTTTEMIKKTTEALRMSFNLGVGMIETKRRFVGTRYRGNDTYDTVITEGIAIPRLHPTQKGGTVEGEPVLLSWDEIAALRRDLGPYVYACQHLQNPIADSAQGFQREWFRYYQQQPDPSALNMYMLVDPANEKRKKSDWTVIAIVGIGADRNWYLMDIVRDRFGLRERGAAVIAMHRKWTIAAGKALSGVGYEEYGLQADIEYIQDLQQRESYRFDITPVGGSMGKTERIKRLVPEMAVGRWYFPASLYYKNYEQRNLDLISELIETEFMKFPLPVHDDMMDCLARKFDIETVAPMPLPQPSARDRYKRTESRSLMTR